MEVAPRIHRVGAEIVSSYLVEDGFAERARQAGIPAHIHEADAHVLPGHGATWHQRVKSAVVAVRATNPLG